MKKKWEKEIDILLRQIETLRAEYGQAAIVLTGYETEADYLALNDSGDSFEEHNQFLDYAQKIGFENNALMYIQPISFSECMAFFQAKNLENNAASRATFASFKFSQEI